MQTKTQLNKKIKALIKEAKPEFDRIIEKAINSPAIDLDNAENNFLLAKIILCAVYSEMSDQYAPLSKEAKQAVTNLKIFI